MAGYKHTQLKGKSYKEIQMLFDKEIKRVNTILAMDSEVVESIRKEVVSKKRAVPRDDEAVNVESLSTKYPIVDWKTHILGEDKMLVKERFETASPEGYDRLLWGDLITLFEPSEEDEIKKAQQDYTLISWRDTRISIYMLVERKYPLTQKTLLRMLSRRLKLIMSVKSYDSEITDHNLRRRIVGNKRILNCYYSWFKLLLLVMEITTAGYVSIAGQDCKKHSKSLLLLVVKLLLLVLVTTTRRVSAVRV
ncbi:hypothetical protein Tco_0080162 [Tanacetum coccineum]